MILLLTWNPFYLALPEHLSLSFSVGARDAIRNALLFLPVGFLFRLTQGSQRGAILMGMGISALAEVAQLFMPTRTPSVVDLTTNTLGAWMGAMLHNLLAARIAMTPRLVGRLALEAPLMGLLYLLAPLLWVNRLITNESASRWSLTALIGLCGAVVLSDTYQQWWGLVRFDSLWRVALAAAAWFFVGIGPSLLSQPVVGFVTLGGISVLTAALAAIPRPSADHRFERASLLRPMIAICGALFGGAIYHLQRDHVRFLLGRAPAII